MQDAPHDAEAPEVDVEALVADEPTTGDSEVPETEEAKADPRISKLNRENATLRRRAKEAEEALKVREQAELSEAERNVTRIADLESKLEEAERSNRDVSLRAAVIDGCRTTGIVDPDAALALIDRTGLDFEDGRWMGVPEALALLAQEKPYLVGSPATPTEHHPTNPARRRSSLDAESLRNMTEEQISSLSWEEIDAATGR